MHHQPCGACPNGDQNPTFRTLAAFGRSLCSSPRHFRFTWTNDVSRCRRWPHVPASRGYCGGRYSRTLLLVEQAQTTRDRYPVPDLDRGVVVEVGTAFGVGLLVIYQSSMPHHANENRTRRPDHESFITLDIGPEPSCQRIEQHPELGLGVRRRACATMCCLPHGLIRPPAPRWPRTLCALATTTDRTDRSLGA